MHDVTVHPRMNAIPNLFSRVFPILHFWFVLKQARSKSFPALALYAQTLLLELLIAIDAFNPPLLCLTQQMNLYTSIFTLLYTNQFNKLCFAFYLRPCTFLFSSSGYHPCFQRQQKFTDNPVTLFEIPLFSLSYGRHSIPSFPSQTSLSTFLLLSCELRIRMCYMPHLNGCVIVIHKETECFFLFILS